MNKKQIISFITIVYGFAGCSIEEPPHFDGSSCGGSDVTFLGILGDGSLSDIRSPSADQNGRYNKYHICPDDFPYCVYKQDGATIDESAGVMCSNCKQGQLLCDADSGSKECTEVLHNKKHCGGCNQPCDGVCVDGKCSVNECGYGAVSCEVKSEDGSIRNICINPLSNLTCGATCESPKGEECSNERECRDSRCLCRPGTIECNGECVNPNADMTCGLTCESMVACNTSEGQKCRNGICICPDNLVLCDGHCTDLNENNTCGTSCEDIVSCRADESQTCIQNKCTCPEGLLMREGHCIDPMRNNKYCGANDTDNPNGTICGNSLVHYLQLVTECARGEADCSTSTLKARVDDLNKAFAFCYNGTCTCKDEFYMNSKRECVNPQTDNNYCGLKPDTTLGYITEEHKCSENASCVDGKCVCNIGYHNTIYGCVVNEFYQCGAKGDANDPAASSNNYIGYRCPEHTMCKIISVPILTEGLFSNHIDDIEIEACAINPGETISWDPKYNIYNKDGHVIAYANPERVSECHLYGNTSNHFSSCQCESEFGGKLCQDNLDKCAQNGLYCTSDEICVQFNNHNNYQCICRNFDIVNGVVTCPQSSNTQIGSPDHCGEQDLSCNDDEICDNGTCIKCRSSQIACGGLCVDIYDIDYNTGSLSSISERSQIKSCTSKQIQCEEGYDSCYTYLYTLNGMGCETDLSTQAHCGKCFNSCATGSTCKNGECCLDPEITHLETVNGEFDNSRCCDQRTPRKCLDRHNSDEKVYNTYTCRSECPRWEIDVTEADSSHE